ncbi:hypothetical protein H312_00953 [Anncaliia algerae PRA339]|uniref:Uncharacterized protein n=1 Tax=Anncaliia algerae PRA339 TaxID=1288291 RepID=A0A059F3S1_9MICR|nr:hypothetical protein H312_00953 [Anncaliia algerae PRA339]
MHLICYRCMTSVPFTLKIKHSLIILTHSFKAIEFVIGKIRKTNLIKKFNNYLFDCSLLLRKQFDILVKGLLSDHLHKNLKNIQFLSSYLKEKKIFLLYFVLLQSSLNHLQENPSFTFLTLLISHNSYNKCKANYL